MSQITGPGGWMAGVEPVSRPVAQARATYDRVAAVYDLAENAFEYRARARGLQLLAVRPGERVLEIGPGTGHGLIALARNVGPAGQVIGADLSARMLARSRRRAARAGCASRIRLIQGVAHQPPLRAGGFDAVFMSFVLELIDTPQIPAVLGECRRVLRPGGRLAVVSLQLTQPPAAMARAYLAARRHLPRLLDCRPIPSRTCLPLRAGSCAPSSGCRCPGCRRPPPLLPRGAATRRAQVARGVTGRDNRAARWAGHSLRGVKQMFNILNVSTADDDLKAAAVIRNAAMRLFAERGPRR